MNKMIRIMIIVDNVRGLINIATLSMVSTLSTSTLLTVVLTEKTALNFVILDCYLSPISGTVADSRRGSVGQTQSLWSRCSYFSPLLHSPVNSALIRAIQEFHTSTFAIGI